MNFKIQAWASFFSAVVGGIVGIIFAYQGYGVWALVISQVISSFLRVVFLSIWGKWYPRGRWSKDSFRYLWGFGNKLLLSGLINTIYQNIYPLIIGKYFTSSQLGFYTRAHQFANLPSASYTGIIRRVTFPALSSIQNNEDKLKSTFLLVLRVTFFLICPLMFTLIGISDHLIFVLLGEKWLPTSLMLKILSLAMVWYPIDALNLNLLTVKGRSDLFLKLEIIKKIFAFAIVLASIKFGIIVLCFTLVAYGFFEIITDTYYTGKYYDIGFFKQMRDLLPSFTLSCFILGIIEMVNIIINNHYHVNCHRIFKYCSK
jgi:O-antigen/teichoic acid export membrane protein